MFLVPPKMTYIPRVSLPFSKPAGQFLVLPESVRPHVLTQLRADDVMRVAKAAPVAIFLTEELRIVAINDAAAPFFAEYGQVIGLQWPDFLRKNWTLETAEEVVTIVTKTLATGTPYSSIAFVGERADGGPNAPYDWEVHRILTADGKRMLICYFMGPR